MGLAPQVVEEIFEIVRGLNEREGRVVPARRAEHQYRARYARFGYILETGRVVLDGTAEALRSTRTCANSISASPGRTGARSSTSRPTSAASAGWPEKSSGKSMTDEARFEALRVRLGELTGRSHSLARQLGDLDLGKLRGPADLALLPVLRKSAIAALQSAEPPFGTLAAAPPAPSRASSLRLGKFTNLNCRPRSLGCRQGARRCGRRRRRDRRQLRMQA